MTEKWVRWHLLIVLVALVGCGAQFPRPTTFPNTELDGKWFVVASSFSMWNKQDYSCPIRVFKPIQGKNKVAHSIVYIDKGKRQTINGTDTRDIENRTRGVWRGDGWLFFHASEWSIRAGDQIWRIIYFGEALFSPAGVEVLASTSLDAATWADIVQAIKQDELLLPFAKQLTPLNRENCTIL